MKVQTIMVFPNLAVAAVDEKGEQIPELQASVPQLLAEAAQRHGYDLDGVTIETGFHRWRMRRTKDGWRREIEQ
jgi:hypothetical protein